MAVYDPPQPLWKRIVAAILDFLWCLVVFGPLLDLAFGAAPPAFVVIANSAGVITKSPRFSLSGWPALVCIGLTILYFVVLGRSGGTIFQRLFRTRKALSFIGGLFLVLLVAGGGMLSYAAFKGSKVVAESKAYVDKSSKLYAESKTYVEATLPKILSNPTYETFLSFMAPQDKRKLDAADAEKFASYMVTVHIPRPD
jgi:hypothetical protein